MLAVTTGFFAFPAFLEDGILPSLSYREMRFNTRSMFNFSNILIILIQ